MNRQSSLGALLFAVVLLTIVTVSCATRRKLVSIQAGSSAPQLELASRTQEPPVQYRPKVTRDTLKIKDDDGTELLIMKAIKDDESGDMVATEQLEAATVTARFRNTAERHGKVNLSFQVIVPAEMQDSRWQLRFYPDMYILEDTVRLDNVIITGAEYRKAQLRGYQQYNRFLSKIVADSTRFVDLGQLEIFLRRNIPQLYAFKNDSTLVTDEQFFTVYGVSEQQAVEHYTNKIARSLNERRKARRDRMYRKYIKVPIVTEGIRLDTVMVSDKGDFVYYYSQTINTRPRLRKVDIVLSGDIYEQDKRIYEIPAGKPLTFYISSVSVFAVDKERYLTKVIERKAAADISVPIAFKTGNSDIDEKQGMNAEELGRIRRILSSLVQDKTYDLDSILVTASASPEGKVEMNERLAKARSEAITRYFNQYVNSVQDSLETEAGFAVDEFGKIQRYTRRPIVFLSSNLGEDWDKLDLMVERDTVLSEGDKSNYALLSRIRDLDAREYLMQKERFYPYVRNHLYPALRRVSFEFFMHRKDMVKDTVHTTVLDSVYYRGVQALKNMDYDNAVRLLSPYNDINAAVAYLGLEKNHNALEIMERMPNTAENNYMLAILYSRIGDEQKAVEKYISACKQNPAFSHRGNLDPEIFELINTYGLNRDDEDL